MLVICMTEVQPKINTMYSPADQVAVVMVPLPAQGHLNQLLHLSNRLASAAGLSVYYAGAATHIRQAKARVHTTNTANINFHEFPTPDFHNPKPDPHAPTKFPSQLIPSISATVNLRDPFSAFVNNLLSKYKRVIVVYDALMFCVIQDVHSLPNVESYCFWSVSAFASYFFLWEAAGRPENLPSAARSALNEIRCLDGIFTPEFAKFAALQRGSRKNVSGNIHNSSRLIEGLYLDLVGKTRDDWEKQFVIGPFNPIETKTSTRARHKCMDWLDEQELDSVILVSFGTTTSLPDEQVKELAIGLENSEHKFLWVLREADKGDIFTGEVRSPLLPDGFEGRIEGRGMVVRDWAPQLEILGHFATGGFMSHCGWNSCMESISMGVPIATWPMHSDQPMNAVLVTKGLGIGVAVGDWERREEVVPAGEVESAVRKLMSSGGEEIRRRAKELGVAVKKSVGEGGISSKEMDSFVAHITRKVDKFVL